MEILLFSGFIQIALLSCLQASGIRGLCLFPKLCSGESVNRTSRSCLFVTVFAWFFRVPVSGRTIPLRLEDRSTQVLGEHIPS